jgi:hypothetical protein
MSSAYRKLHTYWQRRNGLTGGMPYSNPTQVSGGSSSEPTPRERVVSHRGIVRPLLLWVTVVVALGATIAGCSSGSAVPTVGSTAGSGSGSGSGSSLAEAVAYSQCLRGHGVPNFPDPVQTPSGGYGYRTTGIDPNSAAFQGALQACRALPSPWNSTGQELSPAQQQAWLNWAKCIRAHGVPDFPDPTFSGSEVRETGAGSSSPQLQSAMDACKSQQPSVGGLGG